MATSRFHTDIAASGVLNLIDRFGEAVTYNGSPITAIVDGPDVSTGSKTSERYHRDGRDEEQTTMVSAAASDVASPALEDAVIIDSVTWTVIGFERTDSWTRLVCERMEPTERSRQGFRQG